MAILRNPNKDKFTIVDNYALKDGNLSLKSRGLLITMLSLPDDWKFSENGLCAILPKDGQASIRSGLKELEQNGYLTRERTRDANGRVSDVVWTIRDKPHVENPSVVNPSLDNPNLENQPQLNTKQSITDKSITDLLNTKSTARKRATPARESFGEYGWVKLTEEEHNRLINEYGLSEVQRAIAYIDESAQSTGNKNKWKDWNLVVRKCIRDGWGKRQQQQQSAGGSFKDVFGDW